MELSKPVEVCKFKIKDFFKKESKMCPTRFEMKQSIHPEY